MAQAERDRTVTLPRCGKCARGSHMRCEHPRFVEGVGDGKVNTCCCVTKIERAGDRRD